MTRQYTSDYIRPEDDHDYEDLYDFIHKYEITEADSGAVFQLTWEPELLAPTLVALKYDSIAKPYKGAPKQKNKNHMSWVTKYGFLSYMKTENSKIFKEVEKNYDRIVRNRSERKGIKIAKREIFSEAQTRPVGYLQRSQNRKYFPSALVYEFAENFTAYLNMHSHDIAMFFYFYGIRNAIYLPGERRDISRIIGWYESKFKERLHRLEHTIKFHKLPKVKEYPRREDYKIRGYWENLDDLEDE
jgi:hypothetical protein